MNAFTSILNQMPMLLICVPLCGLFSLGMSRWWGERFIQRTLLLNGALSMLCTLLMVTNFSHDPQRTRLNAAESFQSINVLVLQQSETSGYRFGVDGCSFLLIVCAAALPFLIGLEKYILSDQQPLATRPVSPPTSLSRAMGLLVFQLLMYCFLLTIDRRVQMVTLLFIPLSVHFLLATLVSPQHRQGLSRRMRQLLLSDFLIVAGILSTLTPLMRYTALENDPAELFDIPRILAAIELAKFEDLTGHDRLMRSISPALSVMIVGCVMRFGSFPFTKDSRKMWSDTAPITRLIFWCYGPVLGTAVILRECQLFPFVAYRMFSILSYAWCVGLLWLAITSRIRSDKPDDSQSFLFLSTMLILTLGGSNKTSIAAAMLLLMTIGLKSAIPQQTKSSRFSSVWLCQWTASVFLVSGLILGLVGTWQSTGPGSREVGAALIVGIAILLMKSQHKVCDDRGRNSVSSHRLLAQNFVRVPRRNHELPVWEIGEHPTTLEPQSGFLKTSVVLVVAVLILLMPQVIWTHIRWDLQKLEFPVSAGGFSLEEKQQ